MKLRQTYWSNETKWTYAKVADIGDKEAAIEDLRALAEFMVDTKQTTLDMQPTTPLRRALQHHMAQDLCLTTGSEGDGEGRHVVVRKTLLGLPAGPVRASLCSVNSDQRQVALPNPFIPRP